MEIKSLKGLDNIVKSYKNITLLICALSLVVAALSVCLSFKSYQDSTARIYVLKDYGAEQVIDKRAQIKAHSEMFYHLFWEYDPSNFTKRINDALYLIGADGQTLRNEYAASGWFQRMQQNNIRFSVIIDSMKVDDHTYPYQVLVYGKQVILSESGTTFNNLWSKFEVINVSNNDKNPFGLQIQKFKLYNNSAYVEKK